MRVLVLGGDGYLGWATAMHLSAHGHEVCVCDNYLRRKLNSQFASEPLFVVPTLEERAQVWQGLTKRKIHTQVGDVANWQFLRALCGEFIPDAVIHYAELPSAPFSMIDRDCAALVLQNNLGTTLNIIHAVHETCPQAHIIKFGTMGEYGTPNIDIEEGWIGITHNGRHDTFLYPRQGGSLYHTTKIMSTDLLWFYVRTWGLRVTDLMQGPVYGLTTDECRAAPALMPHFSYDAIFGTVINRFVVQAVAGIPLTVYGAGTQRRGFLNLRDTLQCVRLVLENPPAAGQLRICNQFVEVFSILELADRVVAAARRHGLAASLEHLANPRPEAECHYYNPVHANLMALGLRPHLLTDEVLAEMIGVVQGFTDRIDLRHISPRVKW
jgi:UDP-sulfoquinovose synthase